MDHVQQVDSHCCPNMAATHFEWGCGNQYYGCRLHGQPLPAVMSALEVVYAQVIMVTRWLMAEAITKMLYRIRRDNRQRIKVSPGTCRRAAWWHYGPTVQRVLVEELPGNVYSFIKVNGLDGKHLDTVNAHDKPKGAEKQKVSHSLKLFLKVLSGEVLRDLSLRFLQR